MFYCNSCLTDLHLIMDSSFEVKLSSLVVLIVLTEMFGHSQIVFLTGIISNHLSILSHVVMTLQVDTLDTCKYSCVYRYMYTYMYT